jgi:hypothetical protein
MDANYIRRYQKGILRKDDDVCGYFTILHNQELCDLYSLVCFVMNTEIPGNHDVPGTSLLWVAEECTENACGMTACVCRNCVFVFVMCTCLVPQNI